MNPWILTEDSLPIEGLEVEVMNGEDLTILIYKGNLWWLRDLSMYVYYTPTKWRYL